MCPFLSHLSARSGSCTVSYIAGQACELCTEAAGAEVFLVGLWDYQASAGTGVVVCPAELRYAV